MAVEIWLGPSGAEILLPPVNWISGSPGQYPESFKKNYESAVMLDGRIRYDFKQYSQRSWRLDWAMLEKADIDTLQALADLRQSLRLNQGMMPQKVWREVAVTSFAVVALLNTFRAGSTPKFRASMTLEEAS